MEIAYIICKNKEEASKIGRDLLNKKLVACVNMFPIESSYWWNEKIVDNKEFVLIAKTIGRFAELEKAVKKIHSYEIPCILLFNVQANKEYEKWAAGSLK